MEGQNSVSVVIPVYNRSELIVRCLDSVRRQSFRPLRIIVVDNNSSDSTAETVREWIMRNEDPTLRIDLLSEPTPGASAARNTGLAKVTSTHTLFFDSDDEMHPALIAEAMSAIGDNDIVYWKADVINIDRTVRPKPFHTDRLLMRQIFNSQLSTQQYMARTEVFRNAGGWNNNAKVWNDWELGIRIILSDIKAEAIPRTLVMIHAQENSITGRCFHEKIGEWENTISIVEQDIQKANISRTQKKKLNKAISYCKMILASHYAQEGYTDDASKLIKEATKPLPNPQQLWLKLLYRYTLKGGRGAYYLWLPRLQ